MKLRILIAGLVCGLAALAAESGAELFQKARTQEIGAGNLEEAIKLYQSVAKEFASDRALAAKALMAAAHCYELLGQDKQANAVKLYEQVARDFGDQRQPVEAARAKLAALRQGDRAAEAATMRARRIELPASGIADGQHVLSFDRSAGTSTITLSDVAGTNKRVIFKGKPGELVGAHPSRDYSMFLLLKPQSTPMSLAVIKADGTGYREIGSLEGRDAFPTFSWDNRYVLIGDRLPDGSSRLLRITVADGQRLEVLPRAKTEISNASFSPDGRFIAYTEGTGASSKVFVLPSQGGESRLVSSESSFVDWTRDGRYLAINSGGPLLRALYLLPVKDGQAAGEPVFIRDGSIQGGRTTASGALFYRAMSPLRGSVFLGTLDPDGRLVSWKPFDLRSIFPDPDASWSPDSRQIAYSAGNVEGWGLVWAVHVRNIASGEDHGLYSTADRPFCVWAAQHPKLYCAEIEPGSRITRMLSIDVDSGRVERLGSLPGIVARQPQSTRDDSALYMIVGGQELFKWDIATHQETSMGPDRGVSPDERWIWTAKLPPEPQPDPAIKFTIGLRPVSGTEWRRVGFRIDPPIGDPVGNPNIHLAFTLDGNWLYFHDRDSAGKDALFRIPAAGGEPERMGEFPLHTVMGQMKISPDGRKVIVSGSPNNTAARPQDEAWLLENFEPKAPAAK